MKRYLLLCLLFTGSFLFGGCASWLDVVPEKDIETIATDFEKRENAELWLKTCYVFMEKNVAEAVYTNSLNPAYLGADEFCGREYARKQTPYLYIGDGLQMAQNPRGNVWHKQQYWAAIRYCNIFIENIDNVYTMKDDEKKVWKAEVQAVKAFYYFDLMRRYGPIVLIDENTDPNLEFDKLQQFRRPIDECVKAIVDLCDAAIPELPYQSGKTTLHSLFFNKEATATLKAMALLYAASPLFNGNPLLQGFTNKKGEPLFPAYDKEKWRLAAEACDEAIKICKEAGKKLVAGSSGRPSALLNTMMDIERTWIGDGYNSTEALLTINNSTDILPNMLVPKSTVWGYNDPSSNGCLAAPMKMVEMFHTDNGLPIEEDRQWLASKYMLTKETDNTRYANVLPINTPILSLHCRREPRFYAMIAGDRMIWYRKATNGSTAYHAQPIETRQGNTLGMTATRFDENTAQNVTGYWIKKHQSSEYTLQDYMQSVSTGQPKVRYVFRLAELYLAASEAWNEYLDAPDGRVYDPLDEVRVRAGILKVRDAWRNFAKNTGKVETQAGMREIIQREWNIEFMFEGRRYWNLRRWMTAPNELNAPQYGWNATASTAEGFYNNFEGPIIVWPKRKFESPKDYFTPIRAEEILVSGVKQNPGW